MGLKTFLKDIAQNPDYYKKVVTRKRGMSASDESWIDANCGNAGKLFTTFIRNRKNK